MIREDYVMRLIRQLVEAIARIAGYRKRGEHDKAMAAIGQAWEDLGVPRELVVASNGSTLASLLREPARKRVTAELLAEEAHVMHAKGDPLNANALRMRAVELFARARAEDADASDDNAIAELGRYLAPGALTDAIERARD